MVLSWAFLYEFVCIWKTLSCPHWMKRWIGFWRALTVSKHGKEAEDGSALFCGFVCSLVFCCGRPSPVHLNEETDRSDRLLTVSKHRKQKMEVICFVSFFALLFVCVWKTFSSCSHLKKRPIDLMVFEAREGSRRWKWFVLWVSLLSCFLLWKTFSCSSERSTS